MSGAAQLPALRNDPVISRLESARTMLAEANTVQMSKAIVDIAAAAEIYARRQQLGQEAIDFAHAIKIEALRKVGGLLKETPRNEGALRRGADQEPRDSTPTLAELGIDKKTSSIAQKLAALPAADFEAVRDGHETIGKAIAKVAERREPQRPAPRQAAPAAPDGLQEKYEALNADYHELLATCTEQEQAIARYQDIEGGNADQRIRTLELSLEQANRARDAALTEAEQKGRQIRRLEAELKKLGWSKGGAK